MGAPSVRVYWIFSIISGLVSHITAVQIWRTPAELGTSIPAGCRAALTTNITCPEWLITPAQIVNEVPINDTFLAEYCETSCRTSMQKFAALVETRCGDTIYSFGNSTKQSGNDIAKPLLWAQNMACLEDSRSDRLCLPSITNHTAEACEDCTLQYMAGMLNSTYGHQKINEKSFSSLLSSCSASTTAYPHATMTFPPMPTSTSNSTAGCIGIDYTVAEGDTCKSIAAANSLSYYRLLSDNSLDLKCESLTVGTDLCIGDSCTLHTVSASETCKDILIDKDFTITELLAWNPILHAECDNIASLVGHTICVSPPGSGDWDVPLTMTYNETFTLPTGNWVSLPAASIGPNMTRTDPYAFGTVATVTASANTTYASLGAARITDCPITADDVDNGFEWDLLPDDCSSLLEPFCTPFLDEPAPASISFAASCMPSAIMGW